MKLVKATALAVMLGWTQSAYSQSEPSFPVNSKAMDVGEGLPDGKPIDVAGFYPGQTATEALATAEQFYAGQNTKAPHTWKVSLDFADQPFILAIDPGLLRPKNYDDLYLLFSSNGSGNQLLSLYRKVNYETGHPNTQATIQAIFDKYGTPSHDGGDAYPNARIIEYGYLDGAAKQDARNACPSLQGLRRFQPRNGHTPEQMRRFVFQEAQNNANVYKPEDRCDVYLRIELSYGWENGMTNPDIIGNMTFALIDAGRFEYANARDLEAQQELKELAAGQRSKGEGAPKL